MKEEYTVKVSKRGAITIPKALIRRYDLKEGDYVKLKTAEEGIIVAKR